MRRAGAASLIFIVLLAVGALAATFAYDNEPQLGLDLQGGASVTLTAEGNVADDRLDQAIEIIRNRVDALGVAEPEITRQGDAIVVNLPGVRDQERALEVVGRTAVLQFRPVVSTTPPIAALDESTTTTAPGETTTTLPGETTTVPTDATTTVPAGATTTAPSSLRQQQPPPAPATTTTAPPGAGTTEPGATTTTLPAAAEELDEYAAACGPDTATADTDDPTQPVTLPGTDEDDDDSPDVCYQLGPVPTGDDGVTLTGRVIDGAQAAIPNNEWVVQLEFDAAGLDLFNQVAEACFNSGETCPSRQVAITLDGRVESAPQIQPQEAVFSPFTRDGVVISGGTGSPFGEEEAKDLALILRFGALPVELDPQTVQTVSATLGRDSLEAGLVAGLGGIALVVLYMLLYYRALGMVVVLGMGVWWALLYSIICFLGSSYSLALTLAGVIGIIVSIGVTVDSYVVYFERLKDEVRAGKTVRSSVDRAFRRAFRTTLAANISAFIGSFLLFVLTVGSVRGFAFFLGLSTVLDVIVAWFFARPLVAILARSRFFTEARWVGVARGLALPGGSAAAPGGAVVAGGGG
ncbi:MAG: protein translocase subunit SecD [Acidimicrobiales bacterium]